MANDTFTVGRFLTQLAERGFPVATESLSKAVGVADQVIGRGEVFEGEGRVVIYLLEGGKITLQLQGLS